MALQGNNSNAATSVAFPSLDTLNVGQHLDEFRHGVAKLKKQGEEDDIVFLSLQVVRISNKANKKLNRRLVLTSGALYLFAPGNTFKKVKRRISLKHVDAALISYDHDQKVHLVISKDDEQGKDVVLLSENRETLVEALTIAREGLIHAKPLVVLELEKHHIEKVIESLHTQKDVPRGSIFGVDALLDGKNLRESNSIDVDEHVGDEFKGMEDEDSFQFSMAVETEDILINACPKPSGDLGPVTLLYKRMERALAPLAVPALANQNLRDIATKIVEVCGPEGPNAPPIAMRAIASVLEDTNLTLALINELRNRAPRFIENLEALTGCEDPEVRRWAAKGFYRSIVSFTNQNALPQNDYWLSIMSKDTMFKPLLGPSSVLPVTSSIVVNELFRNYFKQGELINDDDSSVFTLGSHHNNHTAGGRSKSHLSLKNLASSSKTSILETKLSSLSSISKTSNESISKSGSKDSRSPFSSNLIEHTGSKDSLEFAIEIQKKEALNLTRRRASSASSMAPKFHQYGKSKSNKSNGGGTISRSTSKSSIQSLQETVDELSSLNSGDEEEEEVESKSSSKFDEEIKPSIRATNHQRQKRRTQSRRQSSRMKISPKKAIGAFARMWLGRLVDLETSIGDNAGITSVDVETIMEIMLDQGELASDDPLLVDRHHARLEPFGGVIFVPELFITLVGALAVATNDFVRMEGLKDLTMLMLRNPKSHEITLKVPSWQASLLPIFVRIPKEIDARSDFQRKSFQYVRHIFSSLHVHCFENGRGLDLIFNETCYHIASYAGWNVDAINVVRELLFGIVHLLITTIDSKHSTWKYNPSSDEWEMLIRFTHALVTFMFFRPPIDVKKKSRITGKPFEIGNHGKPKKRKSTLGSLMGRVSGNFDSVMLNHNDRQADLVRQQIEKELNLNPEHSRNSIRNFKLLKGDEEDSQMDNLVDLYNIYPEWMVSAKIRSFLLPDNSLPKNHHLNYAYFLEPPLSNKNRGFHIGIHFDEKTGYCLDFELCQLAIALWKRLSITGNDSVDNQKLKEIASTKKDRSRMKSASVNVAELVHVKELFETLNSSNLKNVKNRQKVDELVEVFLTKKNKRLKENAILHISKAAMASAANSYSENKKSPKPEALVKTVEHHGKMDEFKLHRNGSMNESIFKKANGVNAAIDDSARHASLARVSTATKKDIKKSPESGRRTLVMEKKKALHPPISPIGKVQDQKDIIRRMSVLNDPQQATVFRIDRSASRASSVVSSRYSNASTTRGSTRSNLTHRSNVRKMSRNNSILSSVSRNNSIHGPPGHLINRENSIASNHTNTENPPQSPLLLSGRASERLSQINSPSARLAMQKRNRERAIQAAKNGAEASLNKIQRGFKRPSEFDLNFSRDLDDDEEKEKARLQVLQQMRKLDNMFALADEEKDKAKDAAVKGIEKLMERQQRGFRRPSEFDLDTKANVVRKAQNAALRGLENQLEKQKQGFRRTSKFDLKELPQERIEDDSVTAAAAAPMPEFLGGSSPRKKQNKSTESPLLKPQPMNRSNTINSEDEEAKLIEKELEDSFDAEALDATQDLCTICGDKCKVGESIHHFNQTFHAVGCFSCFNCNKSIVDNKLLPRTRFYDFANLLICTQECREATLELSKIQGIERCASCLGLFDEGESAISALGYSWHMDHFICSSCSVDLNGKQVFEKEKSPYCGECFHGLDKLPQYESCVTCGNIVNPEKYKNSLEIAGKVYCSNDHVVCFSCGVGFKDDEEYYIGGESEMNQHVYCENHYFELCFPHCNNCKKVFTKETAETAYTVNDDIVVCLDCRKCTTCSKKLQPDEVRKSDDHALYCEACFTAEFSEICLICSEIIDDEVVHVNYGATGSDDIWKAHTSCFNCSDPTCDTHLIDTDFFMVAVDDDRKSKRSSVMGSLIGKSKNSFQNLKEAASKDLKSSKKDPPLMAKLKPFCKEHAQTKLPSCTKCSKLITGLDEHFILQSKDKKFNLHSYCLNCEKCGTSLDPQKKRSEYNSVHIRGNKFYCKEHA